MGALFRMREKSNDRAVCLRRRKRHANGSISKPFATIPKAVEAVRELRKKGNANPATIYLREGRHQLNQTLVLGVEDGLPPATESTAAEQYGAGRSKAPAHLTFATRKSE